MMLSEMSLEERKRLTPEEALAAWKQERRIQDGKTRRGVWAKRSPAERQAVTEAQCAGRGYRHRVVRHRARLSRSEAAARRFRLTSVKPRRPSRSEAMMIRWAACTPEERQAWIAAAHVDASDRAKRQHRANGRFARRLQSAP